MPVSVKNSTTAAGADSGKKPVWVQAPLLFIQLHGRVSSQIIEKWRIVINFASTHVGLMCHYSDCGSKARRLNNANHKAHNLT